MPGRSLRASLPALFGFGLILTAPAGTAAQRSAPSTASPAPLQGVVVDEVTYQPLDSATVKILGTEVTVSTDRWGSFSLPDVPPGRLSLQVSAPGHPTIIQEVESREGRTVFVQIVMPSVAAVLAELLVQAAAPPTTTEVARTAADLLALQVPRSRVSSGVVGGSDYQLVLRSSSTFQGSSAPLILIDGVVLSQDDGAFDALERIPASQVERIDVLKGPVAAFLYPYAANGVINVRTKKGSDD